MVGISLALCLRHRLGAAARILLLESLPLPGAAADFRATYSPSFDARATALSYSSQLIYRELGVWPALAQHSCPISAVHVSEQGRFGSTLLQASDHAWPALGYVIENAWLGNVLLQALHRAGVDTRGSAQVVAARFTRQRTEIELASGQPFSAALLVVADGADSTLRDQLGIEAQQRDYRQTALVANVGHARAHAGHAFERFTAEGSVALLPLPSAPLPSDEAPPGPHKTAPGAHKALRRSDKAAVGGGRSDKAPGSERSALVWSLPDTEAQQLIQCPDTEFLQCLHRRFGYRLGRLHTVGARHSYPLRRVEAREQLRSGVVVMGNAAHSLHPIAGQGFNLALRDVARLASCLQRAQARGQAPGTLSVLQDYAAQQVPDQRRTGTFSEYLPRLFSRRDPASSLLRNIGLFALDLTPPLKREFVRYTAGLAASADYRELRP